MGAFFEQFTFYMALAFGFSLFMIGFKPIFQIATSKVPGLHGMMQTASA